MNTPSLKGRLNRLIQRAATRPCRVCIEWARAGFVVLKEGDSAPPEKCPACGRAVSIKVYTGFDANSI